MNKLQIPSTGFPGTTETWKFVSNAYEELLGQLGLAFAADGTIIIAGVWERHGIMYDGIISYNGELMPFVGGGYTGTIVIMEEVTQATYNTDITNQGQLQQFDTYIKRYAKPGQPGDGIADFPYADLRRVKSIEWLCQLTEQATESSVGVAEIATQNEADGDTDDTRIITAKKLANRTATESRKGVAAIATQTEVNAGTDDSKIVTAAKLQEKLNNSTFGVVAEFVIDNVDAAGSTGNAHFSVTGVNSYAVLASFVTDTQINENDNFYFRWFVKNKSNTGFDFLYEIGSQVSQSELGKIQIVILKVS